MQNSTTSTSNTSRAILGHAGNSSVENQGLFGFANGGSTGGNVGVFGLGYPTTTSSGNSFGVYGNALGGANNLGIYGTNSGTGYAGYFSGNAAVTGSLSKGGGTFKIDHPLDPENKYLYHSFVESPDMMNIYNGNITTDGNGVAEVTLPAYFEALNKDFRYQLTVVGTFAQAIVAEKVQGNRFVIKTDKPNVEVSWQVTGVRKDKFADAHRVVPEVEKEEQYKGRYLHAKEYGKPVESSIDYLLMPVSARNLQQAAGKFDAAAPVRHDLAILQAAQRGIDRRAIQQEIAVHKPVDNGAGIDGSERIFVAQAAERQQDKLLHVGRFGPDAGEFLNAGMVDIAQQQ
ncbi:MAG: hypothetical protein K8F30_02780, partial [Taibaiella sp.]|nr:hypothetical protein [Taibaiella sp.]